MPVYGLRCVDCGHTTDRVAPIAQGKLSTSCDCGSVLRRIWTPPAVVAPFVEHWNASLGRHVSSRQAFQDGLRRGEEAAFKATGIEHKFAMIDAAEAPQAPGGLEHREKLARDEGWSESKKTVIS